MQKNKKLWIGRNRDDKGIILTYSVWDEKVNEIGEFNTLKEARDFMRGE